MRGLLLLGVAASLAGCTTVPKQTGTGPIPIPAIEDSRFDRVTSSELVRYSGESEFRTYLKTLERLTERRRAHAGGTDEIVVAAVMQSSEPPLCEKPEDCPAEESADSVVVTGTRASAPTSITNVQTAGVDEGDIVKQIGDYLLVLQDGRIFAINVKTMQLTDRADVYRRMPAARPKKHQWEDDFEGADWYDEMLVEGDHVIITAYSYEDSATEMSIFTLDQASGKVKSEGVFLITSDDYYDVDNYATRIVGDKLVVYTPYSLEQFEKLDARPVLRRWLPEAERKQKQADGTPLLDARSIYKPLLRTADPTIHAISICPLGDFGRKRSLECRTTGFLGPSHAEMFVSPETVYLWNSSIDDIETWRMPSCAGDEDEDGNHRVVPRPARRDVAPGALYRLPIDSREASVAGVSGAPYDHLSMDERDGEFRALVDWRSIRCDGDYEAPAENAFLKIRTGTFGTIFEPVPDGAFTALPSTGKRVVENRFADDWLVFGGRDSWGGYPPDPENGPQSSKAVAVPVKRPQAAVVIDIPHNVVRTERVGNDIIINGYRDDKGLNLTLIGLGKEARILSSTFLSRRYESEGRSHAFNSVVDEGGNGIIGVPTVKGSEESGRWWWRSDTSDLSFLTKSPSGMLASAGELIATPADDVETHPDYICEVSCIDWYGNSRPVFLAGRIFGLMGTSLVEARIDQGKIREIARIDLTAPLPPR
ncbi:beta-propeller domain-containing protein [Sphingopyxis sp.]|uniref:beta-propeller domain-containing protein n=1 Tax=Sphingopyxis sp. TaxID=1908224 RepID=UPI003D1171CF